MTTGLHPALEQAYRAPGSVDAPSLHDRAEQDLSRLFRLALIVSVALIVGVAGWAALASISGAVIASGTVAVDGKRKVIQHLDGGKIAEIRVKDGARVEEGDVLLSLESRELEGEVASFKTEIASRSKQIALIESELEGLLELQAKKLVANQRVSALQREAAGIAAEIARLSSQKTKAEGKMARIAIKAPVAGFVHNLATHTIGGVIAPGATIAEIVPSGTGLVIEAKLPPADIDKVRQGQSATVRMTSFNQRTTPTLDARVQQVSADLLRDEARGFPYFLARIALRDGEISKLSGKDLVPGMPAEVHIETERRSVITYLVKPLTDQFSRAFREE